MKKVLVSGNCDYDHPRIEALLTENFKCEVLRAKSNEEALEILDSQSIDLTLVNRVGAFDGKEGLAVVKHITESDKLKTSPVVLITNIKEKMTEAVEAGAKEGFGKEELDGSRVVEVLRPFLEDSK